MEPMESPLLTVTQAARYLNCSVSSVRRMVTSGRLPVCRIVTDAPRLRRDDLDRLIAESTRTKGGTDRMD